MRSALSVNGRTSLAVDDDDPEQSLVLAQQGTARAVRTPPQFDRRWRPGLPSRYSCRLHQIWMCTMRSPCTMRPTMRLAPARSDAAFDASYSAREPARHGLHRYELLAVEGPDCPICGLAKAHRLFEHRVEHRRQVAGRGLITCNTSAVAVCCSNASRCLGQSGARSPSRSPPERRSSPTKRSAYRRTAAPPGGRSR